MHSEDFNKLSTYEKLVYLLEKRNFTIDKTPTQENPGKVIPDIWLWDIAIAIDSGEYEEEVLSLAQTEWLNALGIKPEVKKKIQLVQFLSEADRAKGCSWCGG